MTTDRVAPIIETPPLFCVEVWCVLPRRQRLNHEEHEEHEEEHIMLFRKNAFLRVLRGSSSCSSCPAFDLFPRSQDEKTAC
jgi:hypothetical protein